MDSLVSGMCRWIRVQVYTFRSMELMLGWLTAVGNDRLWQKWVNSWTVPFDLKKTKVGIMLVCCIAPRTSASCLTVHSEAVHSKPTDFNYYKILKNKTTLLNLSKISGHRNYRVHAYRSRKLSSGHWDGYSSWWKWKNITVYTEMPMTLSCLAGMLSGSLRWILFLANSYELNHSFPSHGT